jgi:predicted DNA-binding protein YlxM (UPF0122 family)
MKSVDTIARVRREHFIRHRSIREISRELNVSRNTVRKILRSGATELQYEREVQPLPTIGPWREQLDRLLMANEGKATRERLTLARVFEELREAGFKVDLLRFDSAPFMRNISHQGKRLWQKYTMMSLSERQCGTSPLVWEYDGSLF